jgi:hypothetical protein
VSYLIAVGCGLSLSSPPLPGLRVEGLGLRVKVKLRGFRVYGQGSRVKGFYFGGSDLRYIIRV